MRSAVSLILFLLTLGVLQAQNNNDDLDFGLAFASHEVSKDQRTSLNLSPAEPYHFGGDFSIEFDIAYQRLTDSFGYILRIIAGDSVNIDIMSAPEHDAFQDVTVVIKNTATSLQFEFADVNLTPNRWTHFKIAFLRNKEISVSWNGKTKSHSYKSLGLDNFRFYFGTNNFGKFSTTDVPPIVLKNIEIKKGNESIHKWLLQKHNNQEVYDSIRNATAFVKNPTWLIDRHTKWTHLRTFSVDRFPSAAFNSDSGLMYLSDEKNVHLYNIKDRTLSASPVSGTPIHSDANQLLYIKEKNILVNYDRSAGKLLTFDFDKNRWSNTDTTYFEPNYWHNNKFYNAIEDAIYSFGGYGHFTYHNTFIRYDQAKNAWTTVETEGSIPPRYLAASGIREATNQALIFGGYGSMSGKQELSPRSFSDLYSFDLKTHQIKKIREYDSPEKTEDVSFSSSLVVNEKENCFYVLSFPKNKFQGLIKLREYSLDNHETKVLGDSIPFHFHDEDSFCDLFYSKSSNELISVTAHRGKDSRYQVQVFAIAYPPLQFADVLQPAKSPHNNTATVIVVIILVGIAGGVLFFLYRRNRKIVEATHLKTSAQASIKEVEAATHYESNKFTSSVLFFGGFHIFDKSATNISSKFTMTLKELFAVIVVHSVKFEKGISSNQIEEYLWPDKDKVSARNNRNVNIKKLRTLLEEVSGITIENNNSYLKLSMDENVLCDYQVAYRLLNTETTGGANEREKIETLIRYIKPGSLLPNLQSPWLDNFKSEISNQIIDTLLEYSQKLNVNNDDKLLLEIADVIFVYDTINQEALVIKCSVLNKKGKYSLAKTWYDHFAKEYKNLYAETYPRTFEEVISFPH